MTIIYICDEKFKKRKMIFYKRIIPKISNLLYVSRKVDYDLISGYVENEFLKIFGSQINKDSIYCVFDNEMKKICKRGRQYKMRHKYPDSLGAFEAKKVVKTDFINFFEKYFKQMKLVNLTELHGIMSFIDDLNGEIFKYIY
jgi:hypothetical protein